MRQLTKLSLVWFAVIVVSLLLVGAAVCRHYRVYSFRSWEAYQAMANECHPVWRDYHFGGICAGDDVEAVIQRTKPERVERSGRWVKLHYQQGGLGVSGVSAYAHDGKLVLACSYSCAWTRLFFDEMTETQSWEQLNRTSTRPER